MRHSLNFSTLILVLRGYSVCQFKMFCNAEKWHFCNFNTYSRNSLCDRTHYLRYVKRKHQGHLKEFSDFLNFHRSEKITILHNLRLISFIGNRYLLFITQYWFYAMKELSWIGGHVSVSNVLGLDQDWQSAGPDLGPNWLQRISADSKSHR